MPTVFMPLRLLSFTSLLGILSTLTLLGVVVIDGSLKARAPGSLREPSATSAGPDWRHMPLAFGLIMSGFSGHAVMPSLARDMRDPARFDSMINISYLVSFALYLLMAVCGYLMYGRSISFIRFPI